MSLTKTFLHRILLGETNSISTKHNNEEHDWNQSLLALACEDANSKLVEAVSVADVDAEDHAGNSLLQICGLRFDHKAKFWDFELKSGNILKLELVIILPLIFCRSYEIQKLGFGQYFEL